MPRDASCNICTSCGVRATHDKKPRPGRGFLGEVKKRAQKPRETGIYALLSASHVGSRCEKTQSDTQEESLPSCPSQDAESHRRGNLRLLGVRDPVGLLALPHRLSCLPGFPVTYVGRSQHHSGGTASAFRSAAQWTRLLRFPCYLAQCILASTSTESACEILIQSNHNLNVYNCQCILIRNFYLSSSAKKKPPKTDGRFRLWEHLITCFEWSASGAGCCR